MVFKRPANSRDDRSARAPKRNSDGDNKAKKPGNSGYGKSSFSGSSPQGDKPKRSYRSDEGGRDEKKPFTPRPRPYTGRPESDDRPKRSYGGESSGERKNYSSDKRAPYSGRPNADDKPKRSFDREGSGEKRSYTKRDTPYSGRANSDDKPKRSFGGESGEKRSYTKRDTPYSGRSNSDDKPKRSFDGESSGEKRSYTKRDTPYSDRPNSDDRPKRSFGGESSGEKRSYTKRDTPYTGKSNADDKPKRSFGGERSGDKKFGGRSSAGGFKKRGDDSNSTPFRKSENSSYNKPKPERSPEDRVMRSRKKSESDDSGLIRLNRYISNAGICSRRKADELIEAGVISVNGEVVSELGHKVDPTKDIVRYNGEMLKREKMVYVLLNKPKDYITTTDDPQERRTVMHLVEKATRERIYPIGRLDRNTTGLLLMTNDGELADKLSHPKNNITKLYQVELSKSLTQGDLNKIAFGLELEDGLIKPDSISYVQGASKKEIGIQIHSGKNRIVRRIFEHLGYEVVKLDRSVYANLTKKDLPRGRWRYLDEKEVIQLKHLI
jgi:23S rRNA pseudouridine2605 synthase